MNPPEVHPVVDYLEGLLGRAVERVRRDDRVEAWLTVKQAAEYAACSPDTIRRAAVRGALISGRIGKSDFRFRRSDVDAWLLAANDVRPKITSTAGTPSPEAQRMLAAINGGKR